MNPLDLTRREFLRGSGASLGAMALSELALADDVRRGPAHRPKAKSVIYLQMSGAPPQHDTFDPKPELQKRNGELCPDSFLADRRLAFIKGHPTLLGSPHPVVKRGRGGVDMGSLLPHLGSVVDELTIVRSMHTDQFNHAPADLKMFTGSPNFGFASMGSWASWGLGSMNRDLPTYVVMVSGGSDPTGGKSVWGSGFLPSEHQGVRLRGAGDPVLYVSDPAGMSRPLRRRSLDALARAQPRGPFRQRRS